MKKIIVNYKEKKVKIFLENKIINSLNKFLENKRKYFIVTDDEVSKFYLNIVKSKLENTNEYIIVNGEKSKNLNEVQNIFNELIKNNYTRYDYIIALGGGVVTDLASFVASIYKRGINLVLIPTTLIGQVDASLGGKTAINYMDYKNQMGTIYHPNLIFIDPTLLDTLDERNKRSGYSEIIKYAFSLNKRIYKALLNDESLEKIIYLSLKTKAKVTQKDEYDYNYRHILNYGHTIAHIIESESDFDIIHGEAVAMGLIYETNEKYHLELINLLKKYDLYALFNFDKDKIIKYLSQDKKINNNNISKVVIDKIGRSHIEKVTIEEFLGGIK